MSPFSIFRPNRTSASAKASLEGDGHSTFSGTLDDLDIIMEIGGAHGAVDKELSKAAKTKRERTESSWKSWMLSHKFEVAGFLVVMAGIIAVLGSLLHAEMSSSSPPVENNSSKSQQNGLWPDVPDSIYIGPPQTSQPSMRATEPPATQPTTIPTQSPPPISPPPISQSENISTNLVTVMERLSQVVDPSLLRNTSTHLGLAREWIERIDDLGLKGDDPRLIQRFVLAAFYFATGGARTFATWEICSAVPTQLVTERNAFSTRCVLDDGRTLCASIEAFIECPEYNEKFNISVSEESQRRWLSGTSECEWLGVDCNGDGQVDQLKLPENGLTGYLIDELDLLINLRSLDLSGNHLQGQLPLWEKFHAINQILLNDNQLTGEIPRSWTMWSMLGSLDLSGNGFVGKLILPGEWGKLKRLVLSETGLDIRLRPMIIIWDELEVLDLSGTFITSNIPTALARLRNLVELNLSNANLQGPVPSSISQLRNLVELRLGDNFLTSTIPDGLWKLTHLQVLDLKENKFSGTLSTAIGQLSNLRELSIEGAGLSGEIPATVAELTSLNQIHLHFNAFSGAVPEPLCGLSSLWDITVDCNGAGGIECECCTRCCSLDRRECRGSG